MEVWLIGLRSTRAASTDCSPALSRHAPQTPPPWPRSDQVIKNGLLSPPLAKLGFQTMPFWSLIFPKPISLVSQRRPISHAILTNPIFQSKVPFFNPNHWDSCRFCNDLYLFLFVWCFRLNFFKFYCVSATFVRKPSSTPIWPGIRCPVKVTRTNII